MPFFNGYKKKIVDHVNNKAALTAETTIYLGLSTTTPASDASNITEPTGGNYARVSVTQSTFWDAATNGNTDNVSAAQFNTASADWANGSPTLITYVVACTHASAAITNLNGIWYASITPRAVFTNDAPAIAIGELDQSLS